MAESRQAERISGRVGDSLDENLSVARQIIEAAQRETKSKARRHVPALQVSAVAGALGVLAAAAAYRMNTLLLEKKLPPEAAAFVAAVVYGGGAGTAAMVARRKWRDLPAPLPTDTAREIVEVFLDKD